MLPERRSAPAPSPAERCGRIRRSRMRLATPTRQSRWSVSRRASSVSQAPTSERGGEKRGDSRFEHPRSNPRLQPRLAADACPADEVAMMALYRLPLDAGLVRPYHVMACSVADIERHRNDGGCSHEQEPFNTVHPCHVGRDLRDRGSRLRGSTMTPIDARGDASLYRGFKACSAFARSAS